MIRVFLVASLGLYAVFAAGCSGPGDPPPPLAVEASAESKPAPGSVPVCDDHEPGCPCDEPGQSADCGRVKRIAGNYVWCAMGHQTCTEDGEWGACLGDQTATGAAP